jgi:predicted naringenin-chalcone synthase
MGFATGNPPYRVTQQQAADIAEKAPAVQEVRPLIQRIYGNGKIGSRYMAVPDFTPLQVWCVCVGEGHGSCGSKTSLEESCRK